MSVSRTFLAIGVISVCVASVSCGGKRVKTAKPPRIGATETGIASWYGHPYHGRRAANGEIYDMEQLTAAHRTMPFDTWVRVTNVSNDRTVDVRIQDRGPFVNGRIIDLSRAAARQIEMIGPGIVKVKLTVIQPPKNARLPRKDASLQPELFAVQVGAYRDPQRARAIQSQMNERFGSSRIVHREGSPPVWRVLVGEEETVYLAEELAEQIRAAGGTAFVVRLDITAP
jgi:rare lipoprotein A